MIVQISWFGNYLILEFNLGKIAQIVSDLAIDFEATPSFTVEITAKDTASGGMTGTATLVITVIDVNDNPPVFNTSVTAFSFPESTSGGTVLFTVSCVLGLYITRQVEICVKKW